ncbi:Carbamoyltransferase HypF [Planctomycetes bacterium CA13]|uniref:Carbamoyltransferase n=1 Tax=Novipirellula herctigrandis TaxID=2527986 RepID=A0A5C5ZA35_9BACT|nr:Carbamoyltransferase HypF [Planctomycetes bacterium CA13]
MRPERWRVRVKGVVQGVGFRPFVWRLAQTEGLTGWVRNDSIGVLVEVQGGSDRLSQFCDQIRNEAPPLSIVSDVLVEVIERKHDELSFQIDICQTDADPHALVSPDVGICAECLSEINDPANRRYRYPFTNCTACGPRYTIITDLPYDRPSTTMVDFAMCPTCDREYNDPTDRRFHAQPNACPDCGPSVWFVKIGDVKSGDVESKKPAWNGDAIESVKQTIAEGGIVAIKGVGGFHLACDARNCDAVTALRARKQRVEKPLAVMVADVVTCETFAILSDSERALIESQQRPIVLLRRRGGVNLWCDAVAPGNDFIGVMLAYSPLHALLVEPGQVWVMTSGNLSDEPIAYENEDAMERLATIADALLFHDRRIETVCDDSVLRVLDETVLPIRRSRGYAPLPITVPTDGPPLLAVGGEIKATVCLNKGNQCFLSQHIGDMGNQETLLAMERAVDHLVRLYCVEPELVVADLHPGYLSTAWAERFSINRGIPLQRVQHHHAHVASLLAEHSISPEVKIIGVCFDGTGYGTDGAIWGGEWLIANACDFQRYAHLSYVPLPGGDACIRHPARSALAGLYQAGISWSESFACVEATASTDQRLLEQQLQRNFRCIPSSSMGRLFDAVASLCGVRHQVSYEGQAAMESEAIAARTMETTDLPPYEIVVSDHEVRRFDAEHLIHQVVSDLRRHRSVAEILARFHLTIAEAIVRISNDARAEHSIEHVGLTGGVFQNALLTQYARKRLTEEGFEVLTHTTVPPNDGGLALGQAWIARHSNQHKQA